MHIPGLINYITMCITYIRFHQACEAQHLDRRTLPYTGYLQPYCAYFGLVWMGLVTCIYGYPSYLPWSVSSFFSNYTMQLCIPLLFVIWKLIHKTKWIKSTEADLVWERPVIDAYEVTFLHPPVGFWTEMGHLVGINRKRDKGSNRRQSVSHEDVLHVQTNLNAHLDK
jgi:amino acid transporter